MKGLDGIQGPVYVGTGCVFNRQALYGYDPPKSEKRPKMTCDCWPSWCRFCCCCCCSRKSKSKSDPDAKKDFSAPSFERRGFLAKLYGGKKSKRKDDAVGAGVGYKKRQPGFELEEIEEGLEGYEELERSTLMSQKNFEKRFGQSPVFIASTLVEDGHGGLPQGPADGAALVKEAIHVISCGYEEKTEWGKEVV